MSVRAVLLDLGNTLMEFEPKPLAQMEAAALEETWARGAALLGREWPGRERFLDTFQRTWASLEAAANPELRQPTVRTALRRTLRELALAPAPGLLAALEEAHYGAFRRTLAVYDEVPAVLDELRRRGYHVALVSNTVWTAALHEADLRRFGLAHRLARRIYSSALGRRKPHPEPFLAALAGTGIAPTEAVVVGDRPQVDLLGARRIGAHAVLRRHRHATPPEPEPAPDAEIQDLRQLLVLLGDGA